METLERLSVIRSTANMQGPGRTQWVPAAYAPTHKLSTGRFLRCHVWQEERCALLRASPRPCRCALEDFETARAPRPTNSNYSRRVFVISSKHKRLLQA